MEKIIKKAIKTKEYHNELYIEVKKDDFKDA